MMKLNDHNIPWFIEIEQSDERNDHQVPLLEQTTPKHNSGLNGIVYKAMLLLLIISVINFSIWMFKHTSVWVFIDTTVIIGCGLGIIALALNITQYDDSAEQELDRQIESLQKNKDRPL